MKKLHKRFDAFLTNIIEEHESSNSKSEKHKDLLSTLVSLKKETDDDGNKLNNTEIKALLLVCYNYSSTTPCTCALILIFPDFLFFLLSKQ